MGKYLQIRVSAWTYNEDDVAKAWPQLTKLVWESSASWTGPDQKHGVMELAAILPEARRFGTWSAELVQTLTAGIDEVTALHQALEKALADWKPSEANGISDRLEDALTALEHKLAQFAN